MARGGQLIHGHTRRGHRSPEYRAWINMRLRCERPSGHDYVHYGGRGITVCERWHTFTNFLADMGLKQRGTELDRINNNGNYEPGNCHWISHKDNCSNRRDRQRIHIGPLTKDGHFVSAAIRHKINRNREVESSGNKGYVHHKYKYIGPMTKDGHFLSAGLRYRMSKGIV